MAASAVSGRVVIGGIRAAAAGSDGGRGAFRSTTPCGLRPVGRVEPKFQVGARGLSARSAAETEERNRCTSSSGVPDA